MSEELQVLFSIMLVFGTFFFVASEYALVGSRKNRLEALGRKGNRAARKVLKYTEDPNPLVAASQIAITMLGIGVGSLTEPFLTDKIAGALKGLPHAASFLLSYVLITFVLVVLGELVPKFAVIRAPERWALVTTPILAAVAVVIRPLVWLAQTSATLILRPFGVRGAKDEPYVVKEELMMMVRAGQSDLSGIHADMVARAMRLDDLDAKDIMVHRLDIKYLDVDTPFDQLLGRLSKVPHSRIPVCRGDIDEVVGVVYLHDIVKAVESGGCDLGKLARAPIFVPENLTLDKIVTRMREDRTQILIVVDEYGGTSGLITLEDVVEEIFGELEDKLETERPAIESHPSGRVSARSDVRFDELVDYLGFDVSEPSTETLAQMFIDELERVPKMGDQIVTPVGRMRVENMARRRVTRVSISPKPPAQGDDADEGYS